MKLERQYSGSKCTIYLLVLDNGTCPARDYLTTLKVQNEHSHKAMLRRITNHGDIGSTRIKKHGHPIAGRKNLFVWSTHQGARLLYFRMSGTSVVATHGYKKGDPLKRQYDRAERLRDDWLFQRGSQ